MNDIKSRINEYIDAHADEMEAVLADLVSVPSVKGKAEAGMPFGAEPAKALAKMLGYCEKYGFHTKNHENYVGTADLAESGEPALGVLCHLDVVPAGDGWQSDPFTLVKKDGKLFGRGAIDDKGPAVATLFALRAVKELGLPIRENVRFIFGTDEENGSSDIAYYTKKEALPEMLFTPDGEYPVINLEKGMIRGEAVASCTHDGKKSILSAHGGTVVNAVPASAYAMLAGFTADEVNAAIADAPDGVSFIYEDGKLTAQGKSAHASTPWDGVNALTALMQVLGRLKTDDETAALFANAASAFPFGETNGKALSLDISDERSGPLTLVFSIMDYEGGKLCGKIRYPLPDMPECAARARTSRGGTCKAFACACFDDRARNRTMLMKTAISSVRSCAFTRSRQDLRARLSPSAAAHMCIIRAAAWLSVALSGRGQSYARRGRIYHRAELAHQCEDFRKHDI